MKEKQNKKPFNVRETHGKKDSDYYYYVSDDN